MDKRIPFILLACMIGLGMNVPLPGNLQVYLPGMELLGKDTNTLDVLKSLSKSNPEDNNVKEDRDVFSTIIEQNKGIKEPMVEGDILISPSGRSATNCKGCLWQKSAEGTVVVPYNLSPDYTEQEVALFRNAMQEYETLTCVRFVPRTTQGNFLNIVKAGGCGAYVGRIGGGQTTYLNDGCLSRGTIQHELNHNLGFYHEQSRSDRDDYVTVMTQYISSGNMINFRKENSNNLGLEYDYGSVMHYPSTAFSNTSGQATIIPKPDPSVPIGQRNGLSPLDVSKINRLYECGAWGTLLNTASGTVTSVNYPSVYPNNSSSVWLIRSPSGQVSLQFNAFDVQSSRDCASDYIKIYDGPVKTSPVLVDRACGAGLIPPIISSTSQMLIEFVSDGETTATGFKATYSSVQCGGAFYAPTKNFTSPGYPNGYSVNMDCYWKITAPEGYRISLTFNEFVLESGMFGFCRYDYVKVYNGADSSSPPMGTYCGTRSLAPLVSSGNFMMIQFRSDQSNTFKGFNATYVSLPK
ncbi:embryonic protein UVS.2-like [Spea bombifrons]|uniref:embryonic protein UVS.2-like n=1 Tax=Spea bombifrons TaxID=233779 RepID=UPI002349D11B|nr:embryonic protein UVS.2-like [Spea bombifrons]